MLFIVCGYVTHERCQAQVVTACNVKASSLVQVNFEYMISQIQEVSGIPGFILPLIRAQYDCACVNNDR